MDLSKIGIRIKEIRKQRGYTQAEIAEKINVTTKYVSNIECGSKIPKFETFIMLANALKVDANYLLVDVLDVSTAIASSNITEKLSLLPQAEQKQMLRYFEVMVNEALESK